MMQNKFNAAMVAAGTLLPDALMLAGAVAVSVGVGMAYEPAGYVVGGLFALTAGWLLSRGNA